MPSIAEALAGAQVREVDVGPMRWRLGVVRSEDLIRQGLAMLSILPSKVDGEASQLEEAAAQAGRSEDAALRMRGIVDGMVCAAVRGASADGGATWDPLTLCRTEAEQDISAHRVWVDSLPVSMRDALYREAMAHNSGDGRLAAALATFRGGHDGAAPGGPAGPEVRANAA